MTRLYTQDKWGRKRKAMICKKHIDKLSKIGIAGELYEAIENDFISTKTPVLISGKWSQIAQYLEINGYITTHDDDLGNLYAIPKCECENHCLFEQKEGLEYSVGNFARY